MKKNNLMILLFIVLNSSLFGQISQLALYHQFSYQDTIWVKNSKKMLRFNSKKYDSTTLYDNKSNKLIVNLDSLADFLKQNPKIKVSISVHTNSLGNEKVNLEYSKRKAIAIQDYLTEKNISETKVLCRGAGESEPILKIEKNNSLSAQEWEYILFINKRIEIEIIEI